MPNKPVKSDEKKRRLTLLLTAGYGLFDQLSQAVTSVMVRQRVLPSIKVSNPKC